LFPLFANGINNTSGTGGKFSTGVVDTSGKFDLRISPQIFKIIQNDPRFFFRGLGEDES
jgi:hypothetical protein